MPSRALYEIFTELPVKFRAFVGVLAEVAEQSQLGSSKDNLRLDGIWIRTGSRRAAEKRRKKGIEPPQVSISRRPH
jgi:hypothetical protein